MASEARNVSVRPSAKWIKGVTLFNAIDTASTSATFGLGAPYTNFGLRVYRASTGTSGGSTKVSYRIQGNIDGSTNFVTIGAATRTTIVKSSAATAMVAVASTQGPITHVRAKINLFTTSGSANADKVKFTLQVIPYS